MTPKRYQYQRYLLMTLDPVHPGVGSYRLGRVDLSIAREPGTRLPKIPGSSLHGAARAYAAYLYETPEAAGQSQDGIADPAQNPICYTFGYLKGKTMSSGVVNIFDAQILLFPVHSMLGPVWVSTVERLREAGFTDLPDASPQETDCWTTLANHNRRLNLGWLMLDVPPSPTRGGAGGEDIQLPTEWQSQAWESVKNRLVLVSNTLFSHIVNSNLEVRTSVAINPETGAAEEGALYTYEAIPRATFLTAEVVLDDYKAENNKKRDRVGDSTPKNDDLNENEEKDNRPFPTEKTAKGNDLPGGKWEGPLDVVRAGLGMMEYLGVGGMGTRGFGRIKLIGKPVEKTQEEIFKSLEAQA